MSAMLPKTCTTSSAATRAPVRSLYSPSAFRVQRLAQKSSTASGSMHRESSQPMKTGSAPTYRVSGLTAAMKVRVGTMTSCPGPMPAASAARCSAELPALAATARGIPT